MSKKAQEDLQLDLSMQVETVKRATFEMCIDYNQNLEEMHRYFAHLQYHPPFRSFSSQPKDIRSVEGSILCFENRTEKNERKRRAPRGFRPAIPIELVGFSIACDKDNSPTDESDSDGMITIDFGLSDLAYISNVNDPHHLLRGLPVVAEGCPWTDEEGIDRVAMLFRYQRDGKQKRLIFIPAETELDPNTGFLYVRE